MRARRMDVVDEYVEDGRAAIYTIPGMVVLLSELATSAWSVLGDEWVPTTVIAEHLVGEFGDPGDPNDADDRAADRLTQEALRSLAEMSLVELEES